jgi:OmpA-OmpF porin, OOP family
MYKKSAQWTMVLSMMLFFIFGRTVQAGEIIYSEDIRYNVVNKQVLEKAVDNVIVLIDTSASMAATDKKHQETYYELEKEALSAGFARLPDLGFNVGVYTFTPWSVVYPMQKFDATAATETMKQLPAEPKGTSPLMQSMDELESVLKGLSGKTAIYIFSDGGYDRVVGTAKDPADKAAALAQKYDVCFMVIDYAQVAKARKMVVAMAEANHCSRVIPFDAYITQPYYGVGPLYYSKWNAEVESISEKKVAGYKVNNLLFEIDKFDFSSAALEELNGVGKFLQTQPNAFAVLFGYTDDTGKVEYNMELSRRRAEAAAEHLMKSFNLDSRRVVANWYGAANPIASNDNPEGRAQNRRVEVSIGGM